MFTAGRGVFLMMNSYRDTRKSLLTTNSYKDKMKSLLMMNSYRDKKKSPLMTSSFKNARPNLPRLKFYRKCKTVTFVTGGLVADERRWLSYD